MIQENNLIDTFWELHPTLNRYTLRRTPPPLKQSRLDFFLDTESIVNSVIKSKIETGYRSNHSTVTFILAFDNFEHGKSLWKHNNSLLTDSEYLKILKSLNTGYKKQRTARYRKLYKQTELAYKNRSFRDRESNHGPPAFRADVRSSANFSIYKPFTSLTLFSGLLFTAIGDPIIFGSFYYTLCTRDTINYLTSETDTTRRGAWQKMESGELTIILILQAFMRGSLGHELAEK